jgi:uncharacterized membrane protein
MIKKMGIYFLAALIAFFPAFALAVGVIYLIDLVIGGGMLYVTGAFDLVMVLVPWFLLTNLFYRRLQQKFNTTTK